jgi:electron transport complex protein RnfD
MDNFTLSASPHVRSALSTRRIMIDVLIALLPATACGIYFFGINALVTIFISVAAAIGTEALVQHLMKKKVTISDGSAAVTGLLLALCLPPLSPGYFYMPLLGSVFAIAIVKQCFGGLGYNFVNPALAARAFLMVSWPIAMTASWIIPDAVSTATPLSALNPEVGGQLSPYLNMFFGNVGGSIGETSALALIIGAVYLLARNVINWRIPAVYIGVVALFTWIAGPDGLFKGDALYHVLAGGLMLGAFYMATDYTTSPMTNKGRVIFAAGCGVLTCVIRLWGGYPEGVCYAILIMNLAVPLIDRKFRPRVFGGAVK